MTTSTLHPAQPPIAPRKPAHAADRITADALRSAKVAEWLRAEGFDVIAINVTTLREQPDIQVRANERALTLAATGAAQAVERGRDRRGDYAHYEFSRLGCRIHFVVSGGA